MAYRGIDGTHITTEQQRKLDTLMAIKALSKRDDVEYAQPNYIYQPAAIPNDEFYNWQWHYPQINLPPAWDITTGDSNIIIAVIDSGVLLNHPDMQGQLVPGYDFIVSTDMSLDGDGIDSNPNDPGNQGNPDGSSTFHGTHVAGTVGARSNNSLGVAGVSWQSKIMPIRVLGLGGGSGYDIAEGIRFAAGLSNVSGTLPTIRADIINLSLGGYVSNPELENAVSAARNNGVILIAAAGNDASMEYFYPASYQGVVSVSAVDINRELAPYSNYGDKVDITAPGGNMEAELNGDGYPDGVLSTWGDDSTDVIHYAYGLGDGTSMASPHVAGVAALMKAVYPGLTPAEFDDMLAAGELTTDLGDTGRDDSFGHGLIDAFKAVQAAQARSGGGVPPVIPSLSVTPSSLNFSNNLQVATLLVEQVGGSLGTVQISEHTSWLSVAPAQVDVGGYGSYTVSVDRSSLAQGTYAGSIQIEAGSDNDTVDVIMQVLNTTLIGDAGMHYVLLLDSATFAVLQQDVVDASGDNATFTFSDVTPGDYFVVAGSDMDMDDLICDAGEACGAYPTLSDPTLITVGSSGISGLDFSTIYEYQLPSARATQDAGEPFVFHRLEDH